MLQRLGDRVLLWLALSVFVCGQKQIFIPMSSFRSMPSTHTVDVHVAWLRQKIEPNSRHPQFILTIHGMGYKFAG